LSLEKVEGTGMRVVVGVVDMGTVLTWVEVDIVVLGARELGVKQETIPAGLVTIVV
jgi:hypothetical protein